MVADVKSTLDGREDAFKKDVAKYRYHVQDALYRAGFAAAGEPVQHFVFIAVEKKPPHEVAVFTFTLEQLDTAAEEVAMLMARVQECRQSGEWPGRYTEEVALQLPAYVDGDIEIEFAEE
jgi:exodeoxyribonuclease VIII